MAFAFLSRLAGAVALAAAMAATGARAVDAPPPERTIDMSKIFSRAPCRI